MFKCAHLCKNLLLWILIFIYEWQCYTAQNSFILPLCNIYFSLSIFNSLYSPIFLYETYGCILTWFCKKSLLLVLSFWREHFFLFHVMILDIVQFGKFAWITCHLNYAKIYRITIELNSLVIVKISPSIVSCLNWKS